MQTRLAAMKAMVVKDMFVRTADENYITARWCASQVLITDFLWLSFHCVEKYLKAALLLNGQGVLNRNHDILGMFDDFQKFAGELLPDLLRRPAPLRMDWHDISPREFVVHLDRVGDPDNRYLVYGHNSFHEDVHRLDELVFHLRRACRPLDDPVVNGEPTIGTIREALFSNPALQLGQAEPLDSLIRGAHTPLRRAALNLNFAFAPKDYVHESAPANEAWHTAALDLYFFDPIEGPDPTSAADARQLGRWVLDNIKLPRRLRKEIGDRLPSAS